MSTFDFRTAKYFIAGVNINEGFDLCVRLWKTKYPSFAHYEREVIKASSFLSGLSEFMKETWDSIDPITVQEAMQNKNVEMRRVFFDCIGVVKLFNNLQPTLLDKQTIKKKRRRWDDNNDPYQYEFEDVYELYSIPADKLFGDTDNFTTQFNRTRTATITAVRCWCTTTNREYWIYVPYDAALLNERALWDRSIKEEPDAIKAIAWTIRIDITDPERIYRQGDIIVAKESPTSKTVTPYHLTKEQYLELMYSET